MSQDDPLKYFKDFQKSLSQFQVPGIDPQQWVDIYERNLEAIHSTNQAIANGMQAFGEKQAAMLQASMAQAQDAYKDATASGEPTAKAAEQMERAKTAYEKAIQDMAEISQIVTKTNTEALEAINKRISDSYDEIQQLLSTQK